MQLHFPTLIFFKVYCRTPPEWWRMNLPKPKQLKWRLRNGAFFQIHREYLCRGSKICNSTRTLDVPYRKSLKLRLPGGFQELCVGGMLRIFILKVLIKYTVKSKMSNLTLFNISSAWTHFYIWDFQKTLVFCRHMRMERRSIKLWLVTLNQLKFLLLEAYVRDRPYVFLALWDHKKCQMWREMPKEWMILLDLLISY